ncbi:hypothetical protein ACHAWT_007337 [Skeletonema menzelii]|mmetsp:Transcript_22362/g.36789  ORF Transcript_22362/g.36789 Transcript_22362/m.36789 type:complete len:240 (+) Transcript_22362:79-798(+)|eukprot:scaffold5905_cov137-Skeletonema_menzelii.AAC.1
MASVSKKKSSPAAHVDDGVGKGKLILTDSLKRELTCDTGALSQSKKKKPNEEDQWVNAGRLGFYLEIPRGRNPAALIKELKPHCGKMLEVNPWDDSYNPSAIRVAVPGRTYTTVWKFGGDIYLTRFLSWSRRTKCMACFPEDIELEVQDDPKRKSFWLVPIDIHFLLHKEIDLLNDPDKNVKRQVKQLINYMRGGTQPNPARYTWPILRGEIAEECAKNADMVERLMKKKTAKDWWKKE